MPPFLFCQLFMCMEEKSLRKLIRESLNSLEEGRMSTNSASILGQIKKNVPGIKMLDMRGMIDGMAGLFAYNDGNVYEIQIRPGSSIKDKDFWGRILQAKENPVKKMYRDIGVNKPE